MTGDRPVEARVARARVANAVGRGAPEPTIAHHRRELDYTMIYKAIQERSGGEPFTPSQRNTLYGLIRSRGDIAEAEAAS